jgi:hypothetical protein
MDYDGREFTIEVSSEKHLPYADLISKTMEESAKMRGTGIGKRPPELIANVIKEGNALVSFHNDGRWAGFCYMSVYDNGAFVSNSGLIVAPEFRTHGLAKILKRELFDLCCRRYPNARIVGITTSVAVMKINTDLGFYPTTFSEMPQDEKFWKGCEMCCNHDILKRTNRKYCLCTAMRHDPAKQNLNALKVA